MSSTANGGKRRGGGFPASPAMQYFRAIEECFLAWRGAPLTLGEADWPVARGWHAQDVPLELVTTTLTEVFEKRQREGKPWVSSLRYFQRAVDAAWADQQEFQAPAAQVEADDIDVNERLRSLAKALPHDLPQWATWQQRIETLQGPLEGIEERLAGFDHELLKSLRQGLSKVEKEALEGKLDAALQRLTGRLPAEEIERSSERLAARLLRQKYRLPVLSLFSPEAQAG